MAEDFDVMEVCAGRQFWPVLSQKFVTACFLGLFLLFSHVVLMFCHCVLLDAAMGSWENFFLCFLLCKSLDCFKVK